ncbi:hypothetical protein [Granulicoccus sp. GXG6511]|uniref:hypothetical protein n=1 Tax=Granulicoccus sp. GXG6511 TaxID=3381351 RepID=UPI003D7E9CA1
MGRADLVGVAECAPVGVAVGAADDAVGVGVEAVGEEDAGVGVIAVTGSEEGAVPQPASTMQSAAPASAWERPAM